MTPPILSLATFCLTCLFVRNIARGEIKPSPLHFQLANAGEDVILPCSCPNFNALTYYWFKQRMGQMPEFVTRCIRNSHYNVFAKRFQNSHFSWELKQFNYQLKISNVQISDSATYYCLGSNSLGIEFCEGTIVSVNGSGLTIPAFIYQTESENFQSGDSVTLNCTVHTSGCAGEHSVYWFRDSGETHPGLIHTQRGSSDQCQRTSGTQTQKCVYSLAMKKLNASHTGTYYCAVFSCGQTLIGSGTKLDQKFAPKEADPMVYILSAALSFATVLVISLSIIVYKLFKRGRPHTEISATSSAPTTSHAEPSRREENLHYAALKDVKISRLRGKRNNTSTECVYSAVKL
ncbi:titin-like isoform X2 [Nelusetta ayraudi]|uniref:titin-like isoform X2 n=1 Tax=Nelusetta ayraudi TaxID=303726 RepID=UPI003F6E604F